jgi:8-oxo-dGTP pyrophosphatase MutT (NUDIX family)
MTDPKALRPASTVVLLRDTDDGMETLMLKRNKALMFAGGLWVFPGGAIDQEDIDAGGGDANEAARIAAAREAQEECGLTPDLDKMVQLSQWTTPTAEPKRFQTWIYAAPVVQDDAVTIDGGEIHDHQWMRVADVVAAHKAGDMGMMPPTYVTLCSLLRYHSTADMIAGEEQITPPEVLPVFAKEGETFLVMFKGDAGYDNGRSTTPGARHRAVMQNGSWEYIYEGVSNDYPTFIPD